MTMPRVCVCYLLDESEEEGPRVLLGEKRTGLGAGKVVAPGGKLELGETPAQAMVREIQEESGLVVREADLVSMGTLRYTFPYRPKWSQESHVFVARAWRGTAQNSEELTLSWVPLTEIPYERMWDDAKHWLPQVLLGECVALDVTFGPDNDTVLSLLPAAEVAAEVAALARKGGRG